MRAQSQKAMLSCARPTIIHQIGWFHGCDDSSRAQHKWGGTESNSKWNSWQTNQFDRRTAPQRKGGGRNPTVKVVNSFAVKAVYCSPAATIEALSGRVQAPVVLSLLFLIYCSHVDLSSEHYIGDRKHKWCLKLQSPNIRVPTCLIVLLAPYSTGSSKGYVNYRQL